MLEKFLLLLTFFIPALVTGTVTGKHAGVNQNI